ncbi:hypothetical protein L1987_54795 [Smallanthus sonchifolius]|uniref:Uncharacterized protein n=1 Tax=Smallanthus sonchifolius TaxID=185202 RepID=A0ACB9E7L3_9ASTR|nr:hypothetical protein L1987_54795 [Smallanthus sonchifolius]
MDFLSESISNLTEIVVSVEKETANFKPELGQLHDTLQRIAPIINDVVKLNQILDRPKYLSDMLIEEIKDAEKLVQKCSKIKWNLIKKFTHSLKLKDVNNKLLGFFQLEVQADQSRDIKQTPVELSDVNLKLEQIYQTISRREVGSELTERRKLGWHVPIRHGGIVGFDEPLKKLKAKVLEDIDTHNRGSMEIDDESSVVVVAAAGGCGKTTLMVKFCKKHPLTLREVGMSLNGRHESAWRSMLDTLSRGGSFLDLNEEVNMVLERTFTSLEKELKECFMDFGLFPEDQRIPADALLDMWVHLYNHDDRGRDTLDKIVSLSYGNLVNLVSTRVATFFQSCSVYIMLLIIDLKHLIVGEWFSSRWGDMKVPEVEVMVLNLQSKTYSLPHFMNEMQKLKILNVTNYGLYPAYIENFHLLGCLSNLSRIRLEHVAISSLSASILALENLQKVSFIMCKIGNAFETELSSNNLKVWPRLVELEMDYCQDLVEFPGLLCNSVHLKTLSITNCNELCDISKQIGMLTNLENLSLRSCTKLEKLPESITRLQKLSILDISDCFSLRVLPEEIGKLGGLRIINMKGCRVPTLPGGIVLFEEPLKKLKAKILADFKGRNESSVVVVAAAGGCGKTTLVTMLCHDSEVKATYGENIFFVTVPGTPNFKAIVNHLLSQKAMFQSDEDAKDKLENFLREQVVCAPILLILDDAKAIFMRSAFSEHKRILTIEDDLVNQMVKHCKKHPLTLSMVGSSLNGKPKFVWNSVMKTLSQGEWVLDKKDVTERLKSTIEQLDEEFKKCLLEFEALDEIFKKCLLDLVVFPRDHIIPACALLDMWTNLYDHDDMGRDTLIKIFQLADRNLVSSITIGYFDLSYYFVTLKLQVLVF